MGRLQDGVWVDQRYDTKSTNGKFVRKDSAFRNWITSDGASGPSGVGGFKAEPNRYHLYVSHACPWAHRTMIFRLLKGLENSVSVSVVHWMMGEQGWTFDLTDGVIKDSVNGAEYLHQIYTKANARYSGLVSVPVLWDKQLGTIVNNESSEIIRMFNSTFDNVGAVAGDFYPKPLRPQIDEMNDQIYNTVNNGVYKAGFATSQKAYEDAVTALFETLDGLEYRLSNNRYLLGRILTEADWRLFTTLVRFDPVYVGQFKCNLKRIYDYPNLSNYVRELYQMPNIADTVHMDHIKGHYFASHSTVNRPKIVPLGPILDYKAPHNREHIGG